ncbi:MAG: aminoglycoside phosphotransferase family protein [Methyloligellaceae bacterium]
MTEFARSAATACESLLQAKVLRTDQPGGRSRKSVRVYLEDGCVIATQRRNANRAALEALVLRELHARGAPVPKILAFKDGWLIQENLGDRRLSTALADVGKEEGEKHLEAALSSLLEIHQAGRAAGLETRIVTIGQKPEWLTKLLYMPERLGNHVDLPPPPLPLEPLRSCLAVTEPHFIKWDARPGNAIMRKDGHIAWFDWEHCGCRNALDDVAWLLADEYAPDWPDAEERLIARYLPEIAAREAPDAAIEYLKIFGTIHSCVRLALIFSKKGSGGWWDEEYCLAGDKAGVTKAAAQRLCARAARWSENSPLTQDLVPWFKEISARIAEIN